MRRSHGPPGGYLTKLASGPLDIVPCGKCGMATFRRGHVRVTPYCRH